MKVLLVNGSSRKNGCTAAALAEVEKSLHEEGIETETVFIGNQPLSDCIACGTCREKGVCVFDDVVNQIVEKAKPVMALCLVRRCIMLIPAQGFWLSWTGLFIPAENISLLSRQQQY